MYLFNPESIALTIGFCILHDSTKKKVYTHMSLAVTCNTDINNNNNNNNHFILHNTENIIQQKNTLSLNKQKKLLKINKYYYNLHPLSVLCA